MQDKVYILQLENERISRSKVHEWGLRLLQFALESYEATDNHGAETLLTWVSRSDLKNPFAGTLEIASKGKPYLKTQDCWNNAPLYFNISHSGNYVVCAISGQEVGIDIQEHRELDYMVTAKRFFSMEELSFLEETAHQKRLELFYRLWTRKEAYGKMLGEGVASVLNRNMLETTTDAFHVEEYNHIPGYSLALCKSIKE